MLQIRLSWATIATIEHPGGAIELLSLLPIELENKIEFLYFASMKNNFPNIAWKKLKEIKFSKNTEIAISNHELNNTSGV